jgi:hypothetical protein
MTDAYAFRPQNYYILQDIASYQDEADFIKQDKTLFRIMALQEGSLQAADAAAKDMRTVIFRPETHLIYGLSSPECIRSLAVKDYAGYMSRMTAEGVRGRLIGEFSAIKDVSLLDLANIKYLIAPVSKGTSAFPPEHYERVYQTTRCNIFRNKFSKERAFLLHSSEQTDSVTLVHYSPHLVRLDVQTDIPDELVLTDLYYPGWNAYVDGIRTPTVKFEGAFRKITVPKGEHSVEFRFQPDYLTRGMVFPILGILLGALVVLREKKHSNQANKYFLYGKN